MTNPKTLKYRYIQDKIIEGINNRLFIDKLPGERRLAEEYNISYMTVRKAIENLVTEGVLYKIPTKGTFVNHSGPEKAATKNIGFFLDDRVEESISSPYYSLIFKALEKEAITNNYNLVYFSDFEDLCPSGNRNKIDGVIISCFPRLELSVQELRKQLPVVLIDNAITDKSIPSVTIDNYNGIIESMDYLRSLGHSKIGFITGLLDSAVGKDRINGYLACLKRYGFNIDDQQLIYQGDYSYASGASGTKSLMTRSPAPTAILCANDTMAIGAIKTIFEMGLSVPDDVSIVGFDDIAVASQIFPPLTTVAAPVTDIAKNAIEILVSMINGEPLSAAQIALPTRLIIRESCINNPEVATARKIS